jgi:hypothetical protein
MASLGRSTSYASLFDSPTSAGGGAEGLTKPWRNPAGNFFWTYYLDGRRPGDLTGEQAWNSLVPLRGRAPARLSGGKATERVGLEVFYYPHGLALVATATLRDSFTLQTAVEAAFAFYRHDAYEVLWDPQLGRGAEHLTLPQAADACLRILRRGALGREVTPEVRYAEPFSIVTVVKAGGVASSKAVTEGGAVHRALEAMASWRAGWKAQKLPPFSDATIPTRSGDPGSDVLYARPRGRVVWFGRLLGGKQGETRALGCYHRNLTFLSMQVESLGGLLRGTATGLTGAGALPAAQLDCARRAAGILGRLFGATRDMYRSWSPRRQIDANGLVQPTNEVRHYFGMDPLA